jgi:predicted TIM-barrel fold metal-dependent hydrolase
MFAGMTIIDADTHLTEPHDLWTSRAPAGMEDRVPRVVERKGRLSWVVEDTKIGHANPACVVAADGTKVPGMEPFDWAFEEIHPGAHSIGPRLAMMDELGIWAQVLYPNAFGFGSQALARVEDPELRLLTATLYNDAMAELQEDSGDRLLPMAVIPWWDVAASVRETARARELGLRGINTTSAPHEHGMADLADPSWDPLWEACSDLRMPVNFHIGAADSDMAWYGRVPWPSLSPDLKLGLGSAMLYLNNAGVLGNMIYSGVLERFPKLHIVSVESAVGWIPFLLRALDYQVHEMSPGAMDHLSMPPSAYYRRQIHACFWFEREGIAEVVAVLGHEHLMFETDYPHPTCTYPDSFDYAAEALRGASPEVVAAIMGGNAARLYRIHLPEAAPATELA